MMLMSSISDVDLEVPNGSGVALGPQKSMVFWFDCGFVETRVSLSAFYKPLLHKQNPRL
jgi:hypothetical protein